MAPCCNNTVTPRMIKAGNVSVGDRIQLDDFITASAGASESSTKPRSDAAAKADEAKAVFSEQSDAAASGESNEYIPVQSGNMETAPGIVGIPGGVIFNAADDSYIPNTSSQGMGQNTRQMQTTQQGQNTQQSNSNNWYESPIYGMNAANSQISHFDPLPYSQMTNYMENISVGGPASQPYIITPHDPLTPNGYEEEIDYQSVQSLSGFLRTQIGRYMRIEQLIGSNTIQTRYGFLVGVGSNFIILQEITTGNIMVLDIFSIRLTYVYYSPPVLPNI